jgi:hypothetical protein
VVKENVRLTAHPSTSNDDDSDRHYENKNIQTDTNATSSIGDNRTKESADNQNRDTEMIDVEIKSKNNPKSKVYQGLLFVEELRNIKDQNTPEFFITFNGFWNDCQEVTNNSVDLKFNYLKVKIIVFIFNFNAN